MIYRIYQTVKNVAIVSVAYWLYTLYDLSQVISVIGTKNTSVNLTIYTTLIGSAIGIIEFYVAKNIGNISVRMSASKAFGTKEIILQKDMPSHFYIGVSCKKVLFKRMYVEISLPSFITLQPEDISSKYYRLNYSQNKISIKLNGLSPNGTVIHKLYLLNNAEIPEGYVQAVTCKLRPFYLRTMNKFDSNSISLRSCD